MSYNRQFAQGQGASPWSAGMPPGQTHQGQHQSPQMAQMFSQPMGPFDISNAWQPQQVAGQQWIGPIQPVQFVPNPAFLQQQQPHNMNQQQRPMHQRSLSAPRVPVNGPANKRANYNNNNFGGQNNNNNNNNNGGNWNNNNYNNNPNKQPKFQPRMNNQNQKGQANNNNNYNNSNPNSKNINANKQSQVKKNVVKPQQKESQQQQQPTKANKQAVAKPKVTKADKQQAVEAAVKQLVSKPKKVAAGAKKVAQGTKKSPVNAANGAPKKAVTKGSDKANVVAPVQSKTAERKQFKIQASKNAESLSKSVLPAIGSTKADNVAAKKEPKSQDLFDPAQLKCVPAVFGFVCKLCDVFLRDRIARREHIESADHMEKFKAFEATQNSVKSETADTSDVKLESSSETAQEVTHKPGANSESVAVEESAGVKQEDAEIVEETKVQSNDEP